MLLRKILQRSRKIDDFCPIFLILIFLLFIACSISYPSFPWYYIIIAILVLSEILFLMEGKVKNPTLGFVALRKLENIIEALIYIAIINLLLKINFEIIKQTKEILENVGIFMIIGLIGFFVIWLWLEINKIIIRKRKGGKR